jgi:uncharacterized repeat protein (TIGR01451 family)
LSPLVRSPLKRLRLVHGGHRLIRGLLTILGAGLLAAASPAQAAAQVDLVLNVTDTPDPVPATGTVSYAVVIANNGLTTATGVTYTMQVPSSATYRGFTVGTGASCSGMAINANGPGTITCTLPAIASSPDASFAISLRLNAQGSISVPSSVTSTQPDEDTADNSVTSQTTVTNGADVTVTLSAPATLPSGSATGFTLALSNAGPDPATALRVQFPIPTGFRQSGALPSGCSIGGGVLTCNVAGPVASGATFTVGTVTGTITAASGSTITGTASIGLQPGAPAMTPGDPNAANNTAVRNIAVTAGSDLILTKARSSAAPYFVGAGFNFVLTASYDGDAPSGLTITDVIPSNYTIGAVAATQNGWSCSVAAQTVTCTRPNGGVAGSNQSLGTITIPVTINAAGTVTNTATISAASPIDPNTANNTASDGGATLQVPTADLTISKTGPNPALVVIGVPFSWTLTAGNSGPRAFNGTITVTDNVPAGVTINSASAAGWSCSALPVTGPSTITCSRTVTAGAPLNSGTSLSSIVLSATATTAGAIVNNAVLSTTGANATDPNTANNTVNHTVTASTSPNSADLRVIKTADLATVPAGDVLTYTMEVVNDGASTATSITLTDNLQSLINNGSGATGQGFVSATVTSLGVASSVNCTSATSGATGRLVTCTIPSLPVCTVGSTCPRVAIAVRPGGNGGARTNTATVVSSATADPNTANNSGSATVTVDPRADVTVTKNGTPNPVAAGQNLTYVVAAVNNGPSAAANVTISDELPVGVLFVSATTASPGTCSVMPPANSVTTASVRTVTCNLGSINNAAQRTVTIIVRPTDDAPWRGRSDHGRAQ